MEGIPESLAHLFGGPKPEPKPAEPPERADELLARLLAAPLPLKNNPNLVPSAVPIDVRAPSLSAPEAIPFVVPGVAGPAPIVMTGAFSGIKKAGKKKDAKPKPTPNTAAPSLASLLDIKEEDLHFTRGKLGEVTWRAGVTNSPELDRILNIPRRLLDLEHYAHNLTLKYRRPGGTMDLWPVQSAMIHEAALANGLLGPVSAGSGKTLASLLIGAEMGAKKIVLLVPPQLRAQLLSVDIPRLNQHWVLPLDKLRVVAYSELSNHRSADVLDQLKPDVIVADECHMIKSRSAARTKRFNRYFKEHPECRFVGLSGTITRKSLKDYQHLSELALKKNSPLPASWHTLNEWAEAIDVSDDPMPPGALLQLCNDEERAIATDPGAQADTEKKRKAHEAVRSGFRRRLIETPGVVATSESAVGTSLVINALRPIVPAEVQIALRDLHATWEIAGDELTDILEVCRIARQLAAGIFSRWDWPGGVPDYEWLTARSAWHKEVREVLKQSRRGMDSPLLVTKAVIDGKYHSDAYWEWAKVKVRYNPEPPRETVWVSDFLVKHAVEWGRENGTKATPAIIWYQHSSVGEAIAKAGAFPFFGGGAKASDDLVKINAAKNPVIVCSIKAHSFGKNLQAFNTNLLTTCPSSGADMEQLIARTHRPGQEADEVRIDICVHTPELADAFTSALRDAEYIEHSQGQRQKLNFARLIGFEGN